MKELSVRGVYLLAEKRTVLYVGHGAAQTIGARLMTHMVKLLGWDVGAVKHPKLWCAVAKDRKWRMGGVSVWIFPILHEARKGESAPDGRRHFSSFLKTLEKAVIADHIRAFGKRPACNDPRRDGIQDATKLRDLDLPADLR